MDVWIPLISACIGGLIATIPLLLGLAVQLYIHLSEKRQKEREAKILVIEKSMGGDIDKVMDFLSSLIKAISGYRDFEYKAQILETRTKDRAISAEEQNRLINSHIESLVIQTQEVATLTDSISALMYSFDEEISSAYKRLTDTTGGFINLEQPTNQGAMEKWDEMMQAAGKLQRLLREKRISIRNSQG